MVIAGRDRGRQGKILRVFPTRSRLIVERVNLIKRHMRPNPSQNIAGGISEQEAPIQISNVMLVDPDRNAAPGSGAAATPTATPSGSPRRAARLWHERKTKRKTEKTSGTRLKEQYAKEVVPALRKEFGIDNAMAVPRLEKIVLNMGLGEAVANPKILEGAVEELSAIAGQRAVVTKAKKSIATYKLRDGHAHRRPGDAARRADVATSSTASSTSRCRASATSAGSRRRRSTAGATTRSASGTISSFRRSTTRGRTSRRD